MTEPVMFPDVEALLVGYLAEALEPTPAATKVPNPRPAKFLRVMRVGGSRRDLVTDSPVVVVEAWGATDTEAHDLGASARALVEALGQTDVDGAFIRSVEEVGPFVPFPDPTSGASRYQFTVQLHIKGSALNL